MAGKTFPGIGDSEDESSPLAPADAEDTGGTPASTSQFYSGPTVVDDAKVEEGLQKLRSLDLPLDAASASGSVDTALDIIESGGNQMPGFVPGLLKDGGRGTFIGHSVVAPLPIVVEPEKPFDDRMRGTLYGHMLHLPELVQQPTPEEPSSRELTLVDRSAPTSHAVAVYQPELARQHLDLANGIPEEAEAYPISNRNRSIPIDLDAGSGRKLVIRVAAAAIAIAAIVGAALIWLHMNSEEPDVPSRPAMTAQPLVPATAPSGMVIQPLRARPTVEVPPPAIERPAATARLDVPAAPEDEPPRARAAPERARTTATPRPASPPGAAAPARADHRRGPAAAPGEAPAKGRGGKKQVEDDPDGTLAPSIE
jgi:hypothetical protein